MAPAGEHLNAYDPPIGGIDDRLEPGLDLACGDGAAEFLLQGAAMLVLGAQLGVESRPAAPALGLDAIERHVRELLQISGVRGVVGVDRHAHRGARRDLASVDQVGLGEQADQPLGALGDVGLIGDHCELIAAQAGHEVAGPSVGAQPLSYLGQEEIAGMVAQGVVQMLEAVEVDDEQRRRPPASLAVSSRSHSAEVKAPRLTRPVRESVCASLSVSSRSDSSSATRAVSSASCWTRSGTDGEASG